MSSLLLKGAIAAAAAAAAIVIASAIGRPATGHVDEGAILSGSIDFLEDRLAAGPYNELVGNGLADRYLLRFQLEGDLSDITRAEEIVRSLLPVAQDTATAYARLSMLLLNQHRFSEALEAAETALSADSSDVAALATLFDAALAIGEYELAESALAGLTPRMMTWQIRQARWHAAHGQLKEALYAMGRACRQLEKHSRRRQVVAWCLTQYAGLEHQQSGPRVAKAWLERSLKVQPGYPGAIESLADLAYAHEDWKMAGRLYREILTEAHPDLYLRLAEVSEALGKAEEASRYEQAFLRIAGDKPDEALYADPLALYYSGKPEHRDEAVEIMLRDVSRRSAVESYEVLSWVYLKQGDLTNALLASDVARRWGAPSPTGDYHRARILEALGRFEEARVLYEVALADPTLLAHHVQRELRFEGKADHTAAE